jgi:hypothetical protein
VCAWLACARFARHTQERERTGVEATAAGRDGGGATANEKMQEGANKNGARALV